MKFLDSHLTDVVGAAAMDYDDLRTIVQSSGVDVFTFIDAAIAVAAADEGGELRRRRDGIVEKLYAATCAPQRCQNCDGGEENGVRRKGVSPAMPQSVDNREEEEEDEEEELDPCAGLFDDEPPRKILDIKRQLEDPEQVCLWLDSLSYFQFWFCFFNDVCLFVSD